MTNITPASARPPKSDLAALHAIPRAELNATDQVAYDVFDYSTKDTLRGLQPDMLALTAVRPMNHFFGYHTFYPTFASGKGAAPFKTLADYENNLKRHRDFVVYIDRAIGRFREGEQSGVVETKMTVRNMIEQLDTQLKQKPEEFDLLRPGQGFPGGDQRRRPHPADAGISRRHHRRTIPGAHAPARFPQDRISAQSARGRRADVHEGRRQALPLAGRSRRRLCR